MLTFIPSWNVSSSNEKILVKELKDMSFQDFAEEVKEDSKFGKLKPTYVIGVAVIFLLIIGYVCFNLFFSGTGGEGGGFSVSSEGSATAEATQTEEISAQTIYVHVSGHVNSPGLVELAANDRVATAIEKAGGAKDDANLDSINLAKKCEDGEQINVPSDSDVQTQASASSSSSAQSSSSGTTSGSTASTSNDGKVNINTADETGLQQISGIGPSKAKKIVDYRTQNGNFKSVDDLTNVSGIGEKTLASIRDQICV